MRLTDTKDRYLEAISSHLRPSTVTNSRTVLNGFIRYLESKHPEVSSFSQLKRFHIEEWLRYLAKQPLRKSTRRNRFVKLRVFVEKIQEERWADAPEVPWDSLFRKGDSPAEDRALPRPLSEDTDRLLQNELRKRGGLIHKGLLFLRRTGLRSGEFMDLKVDSLRKRSKSERQLHVPLGKLHSERVIPVDAETAQLFEEMLQLRGSLLPPVTDPETGKPAHFLLMHPDGQRAGSRFSRDALRYHLGKIEKEVPLNEHPTPHRLRHTFATEMLRAGMKLPFLMRMLGHRTIAMTLRYAKVTDADVERAYTETLAQLKDRYEIPSPPPFRPSDDVTPADDILAHIDAVAAKLERFRRDNATGPQNERLRRFVERLRRVAVDFNDATS